MAKRSKKILLTLACLLVILSVSACRTTEASSVQTTATQDQTTTISQTAETTAPVATQTSDSIQKRRFRVQSGEHKVVGTWYQPEWITGKQPLVIISHGFNGYSGAYEYLSMKLAKSGVACFAFDYYGGSVISSMSGGDMKKMTVFTEREDLNAVLDAVAAEPTVDKDAIYIMGHSQGGFVACLSAFDKPDEVAGLVLLAPALMIPDVAHQMADSVEGLRALEYGPTLSSLYFEAVWDYDIYAHMTEYPGEVQIQHGDRDEAVPLSYSERAVETFTDAHLTVLTGEPHVPSNDGYDKVVDTLLQMIGKGD